MVAVHDGTANINKRSVINVKCVNCRHCIGFEEGYYICDIGQGITPIEECIANDEEMGCEAYVEDGYDDFTARCNQRIN